MRYLLTLAVTLTFLFSNVSAQTLDHVPGELLVQVFPGADVNNLVSKRPVIAGQTVNFTLKETLVKSMGIYLLSFSPANAEQEVLNYALNNSSISIAQFNHYVQHRATTPNDPSFGNQWGMHNTGQNNGTADADIDAPEAWDITTGGLTSTGDTIVVAVIDGYFNLTHEDLDYFKNYDEIPGNNQDDDGNGYVDDFDGWDAYNNDGDPAGSGTHATHVSGISGAIGDNNKGVAGVNWNVKIMPVAGSSGNESTVVKAYGYVRDMRIMYDTTNGQKGAFVVSTNSSFGVNYGLPSNYPIWCAMYDSLGQVGILSACATMNVNANVDTQSDIPTACPSPYMVAVTNTNRNDGKNGGAAYGATTIDLGAPGTSIYSTVPGNNYQNQTGTSMATPHVAGAIALMYAAACQDLIVDYKNNPATFAINFRDFMFDGTDSISSMTGITTTNGRLNLFGMLSEVQNYCSNAGCLVPFNNAISNVTDTGVTVTWGNVSTADSYTLRVREQGLTNWTTYNDTTPSINVTGLQACTTYEYEIESLCDTFNSGYTATFTFTTEGCCVPPSDATMISQSDSSVELSWSNIYAAQSYTLRYKEVGATTWITTAVTSDTVLISTLNACTDYVFEIATECDTGASAFSVVDTFNTSGCGACIEAQYCNAFLDDDSEWIAQVDFGTISNASGSSGGAGYTDFTATQSTTIELGKSYPITLTPGFSSVPFNEHWRVWIDWNGNGAMADPGELVYDSQNPSQFVVNGNVAVPTTAQVGITRMRVSMRFNTAGNPCDFATGSQFGEIEDYCVSVESPTAVGDTWKPNLLKVYPNPATKEIRVSGAGADLRMINTLGQEVNVSIVRRGSEFRLDISNIPAGFYTIVSGDDAVKFIKE